MKNLIAGFAALCTAFGVASAARAADAPAPYLPPAPPAYIEPAPCYAVFFMHRDGEGPSLVRRGPEDIPVIRFLRYSGGPSLNGRVMSVTTGPGAVVKLFNGRHYRAPMLEVGPESTVNLPRPVADSYRLDCLPPPPPPALEPPSFK